MKAGECIGSGSTFAVGFISLIPVMLSDCTIADYGVVLSQTQALSCSHRTWGEENKARKRNLRLNGRPDTQTSLAL